MNKIDREMLAEMEGRAMWVEPQVRSPAKTHGGKSYLCRRIIGLLPRAEGFIEPFGGGGSVILNIQLSCYKVRLYCDAHPLKCELMRMIRDGQLGDLPTYSRETFDSFAGSTTPLGWLVRNRMSRGGLGKDFGWSDRERGGQPGDVNGWETFRRDLGTIQAALRGVNIQNDNAFDVLVANWRPDVVFYLDPPYYPGTRATFGEYGEFELSNLDHAHLADLANEHPGPVAISGYDCDQYRRWYSSPKWSLTQWDLPNNSSQSAVKQRRIECLWTNYPIK